MSINFKTAVCAAIVGLGLTGAANAAVVASYEGTNFLQQGNVTNLYSSAMVGFSINFVADAGLPATGIWETGPDGLPGNPGAVFSDLVSGGAFTASFVGLNVATGDTFSYSNLDFGGYDNGTVNQGLIPYMDGTEFTTVFFADGSSVSTNFLAGSIRNGQSMTYDDSDLIPSAVPLPASLVLLLGAFGGLGLTKRRKS